MKDLKCPYCNHEFDHNRNYDSNEQELECPKCDKTFIVQIAWYPSFTCLELPCANGEHHKLKEGGITTGGMQRWYCQYAGCNYVKWINTNKKDEV